MDVKLAEMLADVCNGEVRYEYSGRNMFGQCTAGVVVDNPMDVLVGVLTDIEVFKDELEENEQLIPRSLSMDNMALQFIIY